MSDIIHIRCIDAVSCYDLSPTFSTKSEKHDNWEFVYIDSGTVGYVTDSVSGTLRQGELLFHRPGEVHSTVCNGKVSASIFTVIFETSSRAMEYFSCRAIKVPRELTPLLRQLIDECARTYTVSKYPLIKRPDAPRGGEQLIRNLTESFLILLMRERKNVPTSYAPSALEVSDCELVSDIRRYLSDRISERVTLDMLSEQFHFGKTHMCVMFKKVCGTSILGYHLELKMSEAKRLLREDTLTVREISERLGFESPEYFSRCFKQRIGYSPRDFRGMLITGAKLKRE